MLITPVKSVPKTFAKHFVVRFSSSFRKMTTVPAFLQVMATSVSATNNAGDLIRKILSGGQLDIVEKDGANDLQTRADRTANDLICGSLKRAFPKLSVIGEEGEVDLSKISSELLTTAQDQSVIDHYSEKLSSEIKEAKIEDFTVWVDPLDGTKEFTEGHLDHVTVLVGIAIGKKAVGGVIHQPFWNYQEKDDKNLGRTFHGIAGLGYGGKLFPKEAPIGERIVTSTRSHSTGLVSQVIEACSPTTVLKVGGAGHKVILLMEGKAHSYVFCSPGCKKWDTCAPEAILHALGGKLTDIKGLPYEYHKDVGYVNEWGVLATGKEDEHKDYLDRIPSECKEQVKDYFKNKSK